MPVAFDGTLVPARLDKQPCGGTPLFDTDSGYAYRCDTCNAVTGSVDQSKRCKNLNYMVTTGWYQQKRETMTRIIDDNMCHFDVADNPSHEALDKQLNDLVLYIARLIEFDTWVNTLGFKHRTFAGQVEELFDLTATNWPEQLEAFIDAYQTCPNTFEAEHNVRVEPHMAW